jgi:hypothetical protein
MIKWPEDLVSDVARRRIVLFLGAGVSMNSKTSAGKRPKNWEQLIREAAKKITQSKRRIVERLLGEKDYLTACEITKRYLGLDQYCTYFTKEFLEPQFEPAHIHELIFGLDSRIVATPNIDKIYESFANHKAKGSIKTKHFYDDDVADAIRRSNRLVLKIHGTIDSPSKMIFTRGEYAEARIKHSEFYAILDALLVTNTFLFLGCGPNDPDIRLTLENYAFKFRKARKHYITIPNDGLTKDEMKSIEDSMNLQFLPYKPANNHKELIDSVQDLLNRVEDHRQNLSKSMDW